MRLISEVEKGMQDFSPRVQAPKKPRLQKDEAFLILFAFFLIPMIKTEVFILPTQVGLQRAVFLCARMKKSKLRSLFSTLSYKYRFFGRKYAPWEEPMGHKLYNTLEAVFFVQVFGIQTQNEASLFC